MRKKMIPYSDFKQGFLRESMRLNRFGASPVFREIKLSFRAITSNCNGCSVWDTNRNNKIWTHFTAPIIHRVTLPMKHYTPYNSHSDCVISISEGSWTVLFWTYPFLSIFFTRIKKILEHHYYRDKLPLKWVMSIFCLFDWRISGNF